MAFITKTDFDLVLPSQDRLDLITDDGTGPNDDLWLQAASAAIQRMHSGLNARYDADTLFAQTGTNRNSLLLQYTMQLAVYYLYKRVVGDKIPAILLEGYDEVMAWLKGVKMLTENPAFPQKTTPNQDYVQYGGETPRTNRF